MIIPSHKTIPSCKTFRAHSLLFALYCAALWLRIHKNYITGRWRRQCSSGENEQTCLANIFTNYHLYYVIKLAHSVTLVYISGAMQQYYRTSRTVTVLVRVGYKGSLSWLQDLFHKSCDYDSNISFIPNWWDGYSWGSFTINVAQLIPFQNTCWYRSDHLLKVPTE